MPLRCSLLADRQMRLVIPGVAPSIGAVVVFRCTAHIDKIFGKLKIAPFPRTVIEPNQRELDFLMPGRVEFRTAFPNENPFNVVGHAADHF